MKIILGIDPGSIHLGYAVLAVDEKKQISALEYGVVQNPKATSYERLALIQAEINRLIAVHHPDCAAVEKVFLGKNPQSIFKLGLARGAALATLSSHNIPIEEYAPKFMKKFVTGSGQAQKQNVLRAVKLLLKIDADMAFDAADALGLAYVLARHTLAPQRTLVSVDLKGFRV